MLGEIADFDKVVRVCIDDKNNKSNLLNNDSNILAGGVFVFLQCGSSGDSRVSMAILYRRNNY